MRSTIWMLPLALMLTACASGVPLPEAMPPRLPPPSLVSLPEFPPTLPEPETAKGPDLLRSYKEAASLYHLLRARFLSLSEWAVKPGQSKPIPPAQ